MWDGRRSLAWVVSILDGQPASNPSSSVVLFVQKTSSTPSGETSINLILVYLVRLSPLESELKVDSEKLKAIQFAVFIFYGALKFCMDDVAFLQIFC